MDSDVRFKFLQDFPPLQDVTLYTKRRDETITDLDIDLSLFLYNEDGEMVVKGDTVFNGKRITLFSSNYHLEIIARARQILDRITPTL